MNKASKIFFAAIMRAREVSFVRAWINVYKGTILNTPHKRQSWIDQKRFLIPSRKERKEDKEMRDSPTPLKNR